MALRKKEEVIEEKGVSSSLNSEEKEAITKQDEKREVEGASTERLRRGTALLSHKFGLGEDYQVKSFTDGGKKMKIAMENPDFVVTVEIKNTENHGLEVTSVE